MTSPAPAVPEKAREIFRAIASTYRLENLARIVEDDASILWGKDIAVTVEGIAQAAAAGGNVKEALKEARNMYKAPVFAINAQAGVYRIERAPDMAKAVKDLALHEYCFKLSPYQVLNTFLAILVAQVTGYELEDLSARGEKHMEALVEHSLATNPNWQRGTLMSASPVLVIPIGAAGCGKSTFYRELPNVVNASCDNIRYMLFKEFGPCFAAWESTLAWWVVNRMADLYLGRGYSVFYNGVNTDLEYRSPITMENPDPLYAGIPYRMKLVYFEPPVGLSVDEVAELKKINLWATPLEKVDRTAVSAGVNRILDLIETNTRRTLERTKAIQEGKAEQDRYDVLYAVPAPIVKLFVEQSFARPSGTNVVEIPRREIPDAAERAAFYREYAKRVLA